MRSWFVGAILAANALEEDQESLLQTKRIQHPQVVHGKPIESIVCPFLKVLARYECIPDPEAMTMVDYKTALAQLGDDGSGFATTSPIFGLAPVYGWMINETIPFINTTVMAGSLFEQPPQQTLGLADPKPNEQKWKKLTRKLKLGHRRIGVKELIALQVKVVQDGLIDPNDQPGKSPATSLVGAAGLMQMFGTRTLPDGTKTLTKNQFKRLWMYGRISKKLLEQFQTKESKCPTFPVNSFSSPNEHDRVGQQTWPADLSTCQLTGEFPSFECE